MDGRTDGRIDGIPQRPVVVPDDATWVAEAAEWRQGAVDARGEKQGIHRSWRSDGTLREEARFVDGKGVGAYRRFHPNGQTAGEGELVDGNMQGTLRTFASDAPTPELLQRCCVPPNAWEQQIDFHLGQEMARRWYDRAGQQILDSGEPHPARPPAVPAEARYDEATARWLVGSYPVEAGTVVHWRRWTREGLLAEEEDLEEGVRHGVWRRFRASDGALAVEVHYQRGLKQGPFRDGAIAASTYADPRAAIEEGQFDADLAVGVWRLRDAAGEIIVERDLGVGAGEERLEGSPALATTGALPADAARRLADLGQSLRRERRVGEAILAMARSAALAGDAARLRDLLRELTWPRGTTAGEELAAHVIEHAGDRLAALVDALVRGGEAAALLRALAAAMKSEYGAARQIVDAALLLAGDRPGCFVTRSLINVHLGARDEAVGDARRLPAEWEEQRAQLLDYVRVIFPTFDFWPARIGVETIFAEFPEAPAQPLEAIRAVVQKLATRLSALRELAIRLYRAGDLARAGAAHDPQVAAGWLPPDLSALMPGGPITLSAWAYEQSFAEDDLAREDDGPVEVAGAAAAAEIETISVDERLVTDAATIPLLMRLARRDWAALTWLCWSCGLDRLALPDAVEPPAAFGRAAAMAIERTWRCRDKLTSGGLVAMSKGVPGFEWEGMHIDAMPRVLVEVMTEEHVEVRAMFLWLCDGTAQSPWQSDLRDVD